MLRFGNGGPSLRFGCLWSWIWGCRLAFAAQPIANIKETNVSDIADDKDRTASLHNFKHTNVHGLAPDRLYQREDDVAAIEDRNRKHVQNCQIDVQDDTEPKRQLPAALVLEEQIVNTEDAERATEMLQFHV